MMRGPALRLSPIQCVKGAPQVFRFVNLIS
jgi:hypothetical protein